MDELNPEKKWKLIGGIQANEKPLVVTDHVGNELFRITMTVPPLGISAGAIGLVFPVFVQELVKTDGVDIYSFKIVFNHTLEHNNQIVKI